MIWIYGCNGSIPNVFAVSATNVLGFSYHDIGLLMPCGKVPAYNLAFIYFSKNYLLDMHMVSA